MALNTNKREGDKLHAEEWNELVQEVQGKQPRINVVDSLDSNSSVDVLSAKQGKVLNDKITNANATISNISDKVDKLPTGQYYGQYNDIESLPAVAQLPNKGYAYVASEDPSVYYIYLYNGDGENWVDSGNKFVTTNLETDLSTKSQTKAPTTKIVAEGIEAINVTKQQSFTNSQKETARTNIGAQENIPAMQDKFPVVAALNDRVAVSAEVEGVSKLRSMGYKVLKAPVAGDASTSFAAQISGQTNTILEVRDMFDLGGTEEEFTVNCNSLVYNTATINSDGVVTAHTDIYIDETPIVLTGHQGIIINTSGVKLCQKTTKTVNGITTIIYTTVRSNYARYYNSGTFYIGRATEGNATYKIDTPIELPMGSVLKGNGGQLKTGSIYIDKISIETTKPIFGEGVNVMGNPLQEVSPEWFSGSDADKIQRAIECFSSVKLAPRTYEIDRPILVSQSFAIHGAGFGEFFGSGSPTGSVNGKKTILKARDNGSEDHIDCIIKVMGVNCPDIPTGYSPRKYYASALIEGVTFSSDGNRNCNGIDWSTPNGPSRPLQINNCTFTNLNKGLNIYGSNATHSTNLEQLVVEGSVFAYCNWGMYATGRHGISNAVIRGNTIEQNIQGGINFGYDDSTYWTCFGCITIQNNEMEGQPTAVALRGSDMYVDLTGNYFERATKQEVRVVGNKNVLPLCKVYNSGVRNSDLVEMHFNGVNLEVIADNYNKLNKIHLKNCFVRDCKAKIVEIESSVLLYNEGITKVSENNVVAKYPAFNKFVSTQVQGYPAFVNATDRKEASDSFTIEDNETYRLIFYIKSNAISYLVYPLSKEIPNTNGDLCLYNTDMLGSVIKQASYPYHVGIRGAIVSPPLLIKKSTNTFVGYTLNSIMPNHSVISNPFDGMNYQTPLGYGCVVNNEWRDANGFILARKSGTTIERPTEQLINSKSSNNGFSYYDSTLGRYVYFKQSLGSSIISNITIYDQGNTTSYRFIVNTLTKDTKYIGRIIQASLTGVLKIYFTKQNNSLGDDYIEYDLELLQQGNIEYTWQTKDIIIAPNPAIYTHIAFSVKDTNSYNKSGYIYSINAKWVDSNGYIAASKNGNSVSRPTLTASDAGFEYFDTTLGRPIYWNGTAWVDANGETVGLQVNDTTILLEAAASSKTIYVYSSSAITATAQNPDGSTTDLWLSASVGDLTSGAYPITLTANSANSTNPRGAKVIISNSTDVVIVNVVQNYV